MAHTKGHPHPLPRGQPVRSAHLNRVVLSKSSANRGVRVPHGLTPHSEDRDTSVDLLVLALRIGLALAFLVAAVAKLRKPQATVRALAVLPLPDRLRISAAHSLPITEIVSASPCSFLTLHGNVHYILTHPITATSRRTRSCYKAPREAVACARRPGQRGVSAEGRNRHYRPNSTKPV